MNNLFGRSRPWGINDFIVSSSHSSQGSSDKVSNTKVKKFSKWSLSDLIDTSYELGFLKDDVRQYSHVLRNYRNYIQPYQQLTSHFSPDKHTAKICFQVLNAECFQINEYNNEDN